MGEKLAQRGQVPLIPLALKTDAWGLGWPIADFGRIDPRKVVHLAFGPAREITSRSGGDHAEILAFIEDRLAEWSPESPPQRGS